MKEYKTTGVEFANQCKFTIIPGLENSNTVSFRMSDNTGTHYYLANDGIGQLGIMPIDANRNTLEHRTRASFELLDGMDNEYMVSLRCLPMAGTKASYLTLLDTDSANSEPRIKLMPLDYVMQHRKLATFDITDYIAGSSILTKPIESYVDTAQNPNRKSKFNKDMLKSMQGDDHFDDTSALNILADTISKMPKDFTVDTQQLDELDANITASNQTVDMGALMSASEQESQRYRDENARVSAEIDRIHKINQTHLDNMAKKLKATELRKKVNESFFKQSLATTTS
jgi:hypothetical protein